jgi:RNA polymerase sigma factor (sigma-70 family)
MSGSKSDVEIIALLKESSDNIELLYEKHFDYCMNFMKKIHADAALNQDVFHDALIVFYEKITDDNFKLNCSIQTYLNSICRNQVLVRLNKESKKLSYLEECDERINDWFENDENTDSNKILAITNALEKLKNLGGKCYEILRRFFYDNHSMAKIAFDLEYTNAENVKNQKARCQKKLKEITFEVLNNNNH